MSLRGYVSAPTPAVGHAIARWLAIGAVLLLACCLADVLDDRVAGTALALAAGIIAHGMAAPGIFLPEDDLPAHVDAPSGSARTAFQP